MTGRYDIMFVGVGGQGLMLLSAILGRAAVASGLSVTTGEQHGLSQRSGSIYVHFRIGENVSPLIPYGRADLILAMEPTEALRYVEYLRDGGVVIMSNKIMPPPAETELVALDKSHENRYFTLEQVIERLRRVTDKIVVLDALRLATEAGNPRTENSVLVGAVCSCADFPIPAERVKAAMLELVPPNTRDANARAFDLGLHAGGSCLGTK